MLISRRRTGVESRRRQIVALLFIFFVMTTTVPINATQNGPKAVLTGVFFDEGVDTDDDGAFDYLDVYAQVNVTQAGSYKVTIVDLLDSDLNHISVFERSPFTFLDVGLWFVNISIEGPRIHMSQRNPCFINSVDLSSEQQPLDVRRQVPLSTEYYYTQFDPPGATLTGEISDRGLDTDGDGTFDYLEVSVKVNVTEPGEYEVHVSDLYDTEPYPREECISVDGLASGYLGVGLGEFKVSLYGPAIFLSHHNPTHVYSIWLRARRYKYSQQVLFVPLLGTYSYTDFDISAILVGVVSDQGVDYDADGYFDYLEIGVQVNVTDPGNYTVHASGLSNADFTRGLWTWEVGDSKSIYLDKGTHIVKLYFHGPTIHARRFNPAMVSEISVGWQYYNLGVYWHYYNRKYDVPLINSHSYTQFAATLPPHGWIEGYVTDIETSYALVGATVAADACSITTDADGYYKIGLVLRDCTVTAFALGYVNKSKTTTVDAEETITVDFALAAHGVAAEEITEPELVNSTKPFVLNATEEAAASLIISEISDPTTIVVKNVTDPLGVDAPPGTWEVLGNYVQIIVNDIVNYTDITVNATIRIYYTLEQLETSGLDESTLEIHFWNAASGEWEPVESHVNTEEHFVWANIDHFSFWALMGQKPTLIWTQPQLLVIVGMTVAVITIATILILIRKRKLLRPSRSQMKTK